MNRLALLLPILAACGDDGGSTPPIDSAPPIDAAPAKVVSVTCPATVAATVMTVNGTDRYMPMATTISVGGIVKFVMSTEHDVAPNAIATNDPATVVGFGATKCLRFDAAGTYGFVCTTHSFAGTITVQ